jgi:hypothetical protein
MNSSAFAVFSVVEAFFFSPHQILQPSSINSFVRFWLSMMCLHKATFVPTRLSSKSWKIIELIGVRFGSLEDTTVRCRTLLPNTSAESFCRVPEVRQDLDPEPGRDQPQRTLSLYKFVILPANKVVQRVPPMRTTSSSA